MKSIIRTLFPLTLILGLFIGFRPQSAAAAGLTEDYGVRCKDGVCSLSIDLNNDEDSAAKGRIAFSVSEQLGFIPAGTSFEVSDRVLFSLPVGNIEMVDAELTLGLNEDKSVEAFRGTARIPFPDLALFDDVELSDPLIVDVGMDSGENLSELNIPLNSERNYLFFELDSGFSMEAEQDGQQFKLSVPQGQHATLVLDTQEPQVYLSGGVNLSHNGELTFLRPILEPGLLPPGLDVLPIGQHANIHVAGSVGKQLDEAFLDVGGGFAFSEGMVGDWLGIEATPLAVEGLIGINPDGLMLTGLTSSSIQPNVVFDGEVQAQAFIPFHDFSDNTYAQVDVNASIPFANIEATKTARLDSEDARAVKYAVDDTVASWLDVVAPIGPYIASIANRATSTASSGYQLVEDASIGGLNWLSKGANNAYETVVMQLPTEGS